MHRSRRTRGSTARWHPQTARTRANERETPLNNRYRSENCFGRHRRQFTKSHRARLKQVRSSREWPAISILEKRFVPGDGTSRKEYLIQWKRGKKGATYRPSWQPSENANSALRTEYERRTAGKEEVDAPPNVRCEKVCERNSTNRVKTTTGSIALWTTSPQLLRQ